MAQQRHQARAAGHGRVADSVGNWVDRWAPGPARPYLRLARLDRPIGTWLLLWPGWWSLALASHWRDGAFPDLWLMALFGLGAMIMRAAGCTYNDLVDRDIDARVARTRSRPIPSGQVSVARAKAFMVLLALAGLLILIQFNRFAIVLGAASLVVVWIYPFMKRITYWPQFVLGLAFNWGALLGWAAVTGGLHPAAVALYLGGIAWTIGYDTIYAHQDKEDDVLLGLMSTALRFGEDTRRWLTLFYGLAVAGLVLAGVLAEQTAVFYAGIALAAGHLAWQVATLDIDDADRCLALFRANRHFGWIVFGAIVAQVLIA